MQITGMTCGHCVAGVTRALKGVPGVTVDQVVIGTASVAYDPTATTTSTPVEDVFTHKRGVCQDFAHLQIACLRSLHLPARYVSGYLCNTSSPTNAPASPTLVGADASHAWLAAWGGDAGWLDVDPTNDCVVGDRHVTVAWGRDYGDVCPIRGVFVGGGQHGMRHLQRQRLWMWRLVGGYLQCRI